MLDPEVGAVGKVVGAFREEGGAGEGRKRERVWEGRDTGYKIYKMGFSLNSRTLLC